MFGSRQGEKRFTLTVQLLEQADRAHVVTLGRNHFLILGDGDFDASAADVNQNRMFTF